MYKDIEFRLTEDGSHTLYIPELDEYYHSIHGAINESVHIFLQAGFSYHPSFNIRVLEIGFGTGLNTILTMIRSEEENRTVTYHTIELNPLPFDIISRLNYPQLLQGTFDKIFRKIHDLPWNIEQEITSSFRLKKILTDIQDYKPAGCYDLVYFDAFAPDKQPEMWKQEILLKIYDTMNEGGILTTYSSKGEIKRRFENCGFRVEKIPGPPGKREMLRCLKKTQIQ
jgi:tRNA U34 5-methylaminomethyl-2-thiouridine-forming methyltransferase MnmC